MYRLSAVSVRGNLAFYSADYSDPAAPFLSSSTTPAPDFRGIDSYHDRSTALITQPFPLPISTNEYALSITHRAQRRIFRSSLSLSTPSLRFSSPLIFSFLSFSFQLHLPTASKGKFEEAFENRASVQFFPYSSRSESTLCSYRESVKFLNV